MGVTPQFGPYTPLRQAGRMFFVSGQVGINSEKMAAEGAAGQTHQALKNMQDVLKTVDLALGNVVKTTIFLKNIDDFAAVNEVYVTYFDEPRPARSCIEVAALPKLTNTELLVEIEAIAYKDQYETNS